MCLLRTMRVLKKEGYRWPAVVHIAATNASAAAMTYCQGPCDLGRFQQPALLAALTFTANTVRRAQTCSDMLKTWSSLQHLSHSQNARDTCRVRRFRHATFRKRVVATCASLGSAAFV
ncbi:hypothetical protein BKA58DRAFT_400708 [Alternaria rosae]|uniref:uncharacterized protein n=1 Tax=Alternaria rosae TaxID=1187941 RepID=UPI001E8EAAEF|nr:uncharacterized protein BKA58DRAFT_400708 [Alternaria rosae]KAH6872472.1 hypothetical protein BKA58DRAFT_400708 [Alternaria rosae]